MTSVKKEEVEESMAPVKKERMASVKKEEVEEEHREEAIPKILAGRMITRSAFNRKLEESSSDANNNQQQQQQPKGKKQKKMKEDLSVEKGEDELSVQKRREEVMNRGRELIKSWQLSARQRRLEAKTSSDVDQQQEEGNPKKRKTPEERPRFTYQERWAYKRRLKESGVCMYDCMVLINSINLIYRSVRSQLLVSE